MCPYSIYLTSHKWSTWLFILSQFCRIPHSYLYLIYVYVNRCCTANAAWYCFFSYPRCPFRLSISLWWAWPCVVLISLILASSLLKDSSSCLMKSILLDDIDLALALSSRDLSNSTWSSDMDMFCCLLSSICLWYRDYIYWFFYWTPLTVFSLSSRFLLSSAF